MTVSLQSENFVFGEIFRWHEFGERQIAFCEREHARIQFRQLRVENIAFAFHANDSIHCRRKVVMFGGCSLIEKIALISHALIFGMQLAIALSIAKQPRKETHFALRI